MIILAVHLVVCSPLANASELHHILSLIADGMTVSTCMAKARQEQQSVTKGKIL